MFQCGHILSTSRHWQLCLLRIKLISEEKDWAISSFKVFLNCIVNLSNRDCYNSVKYSSNGMKILKCEAE